MLTRWTIVDLECVPDEHCRQWLGPIDAPKNYVKEDVIAAYIRDETERRVQLAGLDADLCRIVCAGIQPWDTDGAVIKVLNETDERRVLERIWQSVNATTPLVGYGLTWYDAGVLVRRSQLLNVRVPEGFYKQGKYRHDWIVELAERLTLNGMIDQKKGRGLDYHCRRFGIQVDDEFTGADVAKLWAEGAHDAVMSHCMADLLRIQRLAERLHVIPELREVEPALPLTIDDPYADVAGR
jgi:hypothetical protein